MLDVRSLIFTKLNPFLPIIIILCFLLFFYRNLAHKLDCNWKKLNKFY